MCCSLAAKIKPNTWTNSVAHIIDLQPTCMVMAGLDPVKDIPEGKRQLDGENIMAIFEGKEFNDKNLFTLSSPEHVLVAMANGKQL